MAQLDEAFFAISGLISLLLKKFDGNAVAQIFGQFLGTIEVNQGTLLRKTQRNDAQSLGGEVTIETSDGFHSGLSGFDWAGE